MLLSAPRRRSREAPTQLAVKFVERFAAVGRDDDPASVAWFAEMVRVTAPMGLLYAYWDSYGDWAVGMTRLRTTVGGPVPVPRPGAARWVSA